MRAKLVILASILIIILAVAACDPTPGPVGAPPVKISAMAGSRPPSPSTWWRSTGPTGASLTMEKFDAPGAGVHPTIIIFPGSADLSLPDEQVAGYLAARGFTSVAVCWFRNDMAPLTAGQIACPNGPPANGVSATTLPDVNEIVASVKRLPGVDAKRVGLYGFSRGGGEVALLATQGSTMPVAMGAPLITPKSIAPWVLATETDVMPRANKVRAPLLIQYATDDGVVNPAKNALPFAAAVKASGKAPAPVVKAYTGGHQFFELPATKPLKDAIAFFKATLK